MMNIIIIINIIIVIVIIIIIVLFGQMWCRRLNVRPLVIPE